MQLHLETAELNLVANFLLERPSPVGGVDESLLCCSGCWSGSTKLA